MSSTPIEDTVRSKVGRLNCGSEIIRPDEALQDQRGLETHLARDLQ